jgi:putative two-component system response regulator
MRKVLIVDDNITALRQIEMLLADSFETYLAKSGRTALQMASNTEYDLILLDIEMPDMDGFETLYRIKSDYYLRHIPVIFLTINSLVETEVKGLKSGAVDFIVKPARKMSLLHRISMHITRAEYYRNIERISREFSESFSETFSSLIEFRDINTGGHVARTGKYVRMIAETLRDMNVFHGELTPEKIDLYSRSALLNDIGKIGITDSILLKPGKLDDGEFRMMKTHSQIGADIIETMLNRSPSLTYLECAKEIALTHHERYDGLGYPCGLKGCETPLCGRIMAIADVYDALTDDRVYRKAMSKDKAVEIIVEGRGRNFDPVVTDAFLRLLPQF